MVRVLRYTVVDCGLQWTIVHYCIVDCEVEHVCQKFTTRLDCPRGSQAVKNRTHMRFIRLIYTVNPQFESELVVNNTKMAYSRRSGLMTTEIVYIDLPSLLLVGKSTTVKQGRIYVNEHLGVSVA